MKGESNSLIASALKKVGKNQNLKRIDFFNPIIIGQKQSGFPLNSRGELQSIGQADRVARPVLSSRESWSYHRRHGGRAAAVGCGDARRSTPRVVMPTLRFSLRAGMRSVQDDVAAGLP